MITTVVPVFNRAELLARCLDAIGRAADRHGGVEVVLVDNGSTDGAADVMRAYAERAAHPVRVVAHAGTIAAVRNHGARLGTGRYLSFLDADILVAEDHFVELERLFTGGTADAFGCEAHLPDAPCWSERVWHELTVRRDDGYRLYLNSGNFAVTRAMFERVGGFPEDFATAEDSEICRRIVAAGGRIYQSQKIAVKHLGNPKTLAGFYRRMRWHARQPRDGRGRLYLLTRVALLDVALAVLAALVLLGPLRLAPGARAVDALGLLLLVPLAVYAERLRRVRRWVNPAPALALVQLMLAARVAAYLAAARARHAPAR